MTFLISVLMFVGRLSGGITRTVTEEEEPDVRKVSRETQ